MPVGGALLSYNMWGGLTQVTSPEGQDYNIVFTRSNGQTTKIEVRTGATSSTRIEQVEYTYFASGTRADDLGTDADLVQVKTTELKTGGDPDTAADWTVR